MVTIASPMFPELKFLRYSPASFLSYSPDNDKEADSNESDTGVSEQSEVCSSRKKKRKGRRSVWEERHVNDHDLVDVICSSEYCKKKLVFTNRKDSKKAEIYANVLKQLGQRHEDGSFPSSVDQFGNKFKKCVSECKRMAFTVKTSTGVKRVQDEKQLGAWFNQLFPLVQTRHSCNPDMAVESSSSLRLSDGDPVKRSSDEQSSDGIDQGDDSGKKHFVPLRKGGRKKDKSQSFSRFFSTTVELFEKVTC